MSEIIYDLIADEYDGRYTDEDCLVENEIMRQTVLDLLRTNTTPEMIDVGAGTGLALDMGLTDPNRYTAIDPSHGMLERLVKKHPMAKWVEIAPFEDWVLRSLARPRFDITLSLFGSPSYIQSDFIEPLFSLAPKTVLMHYQPGYWPEYESQPETMDESREEALRVCKSLDGRVFDLNNFVVTVVGE